jgi:hypothetical protein
MRSQDKQVREPNPGSDDKRTGEAGLPSAVVAARELGAGDACAVCNATTLGEGCRTNDHRIFIHTTPTVGDARCDCDREWRWLPPALALLPLALLPVSSCACACSDASFVCAQAKHNDDEREREEPSPELEQRCRQRAINHCRAQTPQRVIERNERDKTRGPRAQRK